MKNMMLGSLFICNFRSKVFMSYMTPVNIKCH